MTNRIFDKSALLERMMGDYDLARDIAKGFIDNTEKQIKELEKLINAKDPLQAGEMAHSIKGAALNVCSEELQKLAYKMEQAGKNKEIELLKDLLPELKKKFAQVRERIDAEL